MADQVFNISKGREMHYASLAGANDALGCIVLENTAVPADTAIVDYRTVAALVAAGAATEQATMGRKTLSAVTVTIDDTTDTVSADCADIVWTAATGNVVNSLVFYYDSDTTTSTDSTRVPLTKHDFTVTPNGSDITAQIAATGFVKAS